MRGIKMLAAGIMALGLAWTAGAGENDGGDATAKKVLMVGNSFSASVIGELRAMAAAAPSVNLVLEGATISGCPLERHVAEWEKAKEDPAHKSYQPAKDRFNLGEMLTLRPWDIVTIQQASHFSWQADSFEPHAEKLIAAIREFAPQAEVVIQQTWAYRADDGRLVNWKITPDEMYDFLTANYRDLARRHGLRIIPAGRAVQLTRERSDVAFKPVDNEARQSYRWPDLPPQAGEVVGNMRWGKDERTGGMVIRADAFHLNERGRYLQAATWFGFLFPERRAEAAVYSSPKVADDDALFLRQCAFDALDEFAPENAAVGGRESGE